MGMTMTQKILAKHAGLPSVKAGDLITCKLDMVLANDITAPPAIAEFNKIGRPVFDKDKIALVPDHFTPNKDIKSAGLAKIVRDFAREHEITHYFEVGRVGIEHVLLPEQGIVGPGMLTIGADSHTCTYGALGGFATGVGSTDLGVAMATGEAWFKVPEAINVRLTGQKPDDITGKDVMLTLIGMIGVDGALYKSLEFTGEGVASLTMTDRLTIANMAIEAGAKNGMFPVDEQTMAYEQGRIHYEYDVVTADEDAEYCRTVEINLSELKPVVAFPHLPGNRRHRHRSGRHRLLHERPSGRFGNRRVDPEGAQGSSPRPLHRHPRQPAGLHGRHEGRLYRNLHYGGLCRVYADMRPLPGRLHGHPHCRRKVRVHDEPQFPRPYGPRRQRGLSGRAAGRCCQCNSRQDSRTEGGSVT